MLPWEPSRHRPRRGKGGRGAAHRATLLPDPEPRAVRVPVISVDDHLIEPPDMFEGRLPASLRESAPRVVEEADGSQAWIFEGNRYPNVGLNAVVGRPREEWSMDPARFDEMRPGCFDIVARIEDMDRAGLWASLCFPSLVSGFCGAVYSRAQDKDLGLACLRAFNDWHIDTWAALSARAHHPAAAALAGRHRGGRGRGAGQRGARLQGGQLPRVPRPARPALDLQR